MAQWVFAVKILSGSKGCKFKPRLRPVIVNVFVFLCTQTCVVFVLKIEKSTKEIPEWSKMTPIKNSLKIEVKHKHNSFFVFVFKTQTQKNFICVWPRFLKNFLWESFLTTPEFIWLIFRFLTQTQHKFVYTKTQTHLLSLVGSGIRYNNFLGIEIGIRWEFNSLESAKHWK